MVKFQGLMIPFDGLFLVTLAIKDIGKVEGNVEIGTAGKQCLAIGFDGFAKAIAIFVLATQLEPLIGG